MWSTLIQNIKQVLYPSLVISACCCMLMYPIRLPSDALDANQSPHVDDFFGSAFFQPPPFPALDCRNDLRRANETLEMAVGNAQGIAQSSLWEPGAFQEPRVRLLVDNTRAKLLSNMTSLLRCLSSLKGCVSSHTCRITAEHHADYEAYQAARSGVSALLVHTERISSLFSSALDEILDLRLADLRDSRSLLDRLGGWQDGFAKGSSRFDDESSSVNLGLVRLRDLWDELVVARLARLEKSLGR